MAYPRLPPRICMHCQQSFQPKKGRQTLCSRHCSAAHANAEKRAQSSSVVTPQAFTPVALPEATPEALSLAATSLTSLLDDSDNEQERRMSSAEALVQAEADAYKASGERYEAQTTKALKRERNRTIILAGHGASIKVERDALIVSEGHTHYPQAPQTHTLYRGQHDVSKIIVLARSGHISIAAFAWCKEEDICILLLHEDGELLQSLTPSTCPDVQLRRKQYQATSEMQAQVSCLLLEKKLEAQKDTIQQFFPYAQGALDALHTALSWLRLPKKPVWLFDINRLRLIEASAAKAYFSAWQGLPLRWEKSAERRVYPHWKVVRNRLSPLGKGVTARHAIDPCNAILNYAYAVLEGQCRQALVAAGFDVTCGILHADKDGRDSLVYDLMELFRAQVDALVLVFVQQTTLRSGDCAHVSDGSCRLHPQLARYVVARCRLSQDAIDQGASWLKQQLLTTAQQQAQVS